MIDSTGIPQSATLVRGVSLARLAEILRFASLLGHGPTVRRQSPASGEAGSGGGAGAKNQQPDFEQALPRLFQLLKERRIRYLLVGGVALLRYVPGRNTEDIDLVLEVESLGQLPELVVSERTDWFARGTFEGIRVDLLLAANPLFSLVLDRHGSVFQFKEMEVPCADPEGLLLLKLYALPSLYRQGDIQKANLYEGDVAALLLAARPGMPPLFDELSRHVSASDLAELRKIVAEAERRKERFQQPPG